MGREALDTDGSQQRELETNTHVCVRVSSVKGKPKPASCIGGDEVRSPGPAGKRKQGMLPGSDLTTYPTSHLHRYLLIVQGGRGRSSRRIVASKRLTEPLTHIMCSADISQHTCSPLHPGAGHSAIYNGLVARDGTSTYLPICRVCKHIINLYLVYSQGPTLAVVHYHTHAPLPPSSPSL